MRKKRELERFAKFCFGYLKLKPIRIYYCPSKALVSPDDVYCFGCYTYDDQTNEIWLAYRLSKFNNMLNLAHEIWHYKQHCIGRIDKMPLEDCEKEAEQASKELVALWFIRGGMMPDISIQGQ